MKNKTVQDYMTRLPFEMQTHDSLNEAASLMREKGFRHIPIFKGSKIYGILSDRDVKFAKALLGDKAANLTIEEIASTESYQVTPLTSLKEVAGELSNRKISSALAVDGETLVGIITATDILKAYSEL